MRKKLAAMALAALSLAGCIGKGGPVEEYLRVSADPARCERQAAGGERVAVGIKRLRVADALDRQSVMTARGRVMTPSLRWYWEASPGRLAEQALAAAINCSGSLAAVLPVRYSSDTPVVVTGTVTDFQVQERTMTLDAAVELQAWDRDGKSLSNSGKLAASVPVVALDAAAIADGGARALDELSSKAVSWLERTASRNAGK